jgi:predicted nucleic acid-binding protein
VSALVVDASVAAKWYLPEEDSETALAVLGSGVPLHAPSLLQIELANAFWRHVQRGDIEAGLWALARPQLERSLHQWHDSGTYLEDAFTLACAMAHPVYDCIYLVLARRLGARLVTADRRLLVKVQATHEAALVLPLHDFPHEI